MLLGAASLLASSGFTPSIVTSSCLSAFQRRTSPPHANEDRFALVIPHRNILQTEILNRNGGTLSRSHPC